MPNWITTREATELSGYHPKHLLKLIRSGKVKARKWVREWQVSKASLLAYMQTVEKSGAKRGPKPRA